MRAPGIYNKAHSEFRHSYQQPTAVCFVDFAAAFDSVHRESLWQILVLDGVSAKIFAMIKAYYRSTTARVLFLNNLSQTLRIHFAVRQGRILSPILFNYAIDWILERAVQEDDGVEFASGHRLSDLDYEDDIALLASSFGALQSMVSRSHLEERLLPDSQCGFRRYHGKTDTIFAACQLQERCQEMRAHLYTAIMDVTKEFDTALFDMLRPYHPEVPKDPRTLLKTPRSCNDKVLSNGKYVHLGIERALLDEVNRRQTTEIPEMRIQLHIDGMKLFKGSGQCLWPILARISHPVIGDPFVVGVFSGFGKPEPVDEFLHDCVCELKGLLDGGLRLPGTGDIVKVELGNIICDAPARSYIRQVKAHNGYYGCDRFVRQLTSDDDEDDDEEEIAAQRARQDRLLTAWPTPPRILQ
nr:unnamed protein product [Spirometra erinaceieuropaei]